MKNGLLYFLLCLAALVSSCDGTNTRYHIGVSQCSDDEWRHKMNKEMQREALFTTVCRWNFVRQKTITNIR